MAGDDHDHVDGKDGADMADDGDHVNVEDVRILFLIVCFDSAAVKLVKYLVGTSFLLLIGG